MQATNEHVHWDETQIQSLILQLKTKVRSGDALLFFPCQSHRIKPHHFLNTRHQILASQSCCGGSSLLCGHSWIHYESRSAAASPPTSEQKWNTEALTILYYMYLNITNVQRWRTISKIAYMLFWRAKSIKTTVSKLRLEQVLVSVEVMAEMIWGFCG